MANVSPERWRRLAAMLDEALDMPHGDRARFLDEACGGDAGLRAEVEALLAADASPSPLLDSPLGAAVAFSGDDDNDGAARAGDGMDAAGSPPAGARIGAYRVVRELGRGGMGAVYLAERADGQFEQRVALKLVRGGGIESGELVRRFLHERQILARLEHPNIARWRISGPCVVSAASSRLPEAGKRRTRR